MSLQVGRNEQVERSEPKKGNEDMEGLLYGSKLGSQLLL